MLFQRKILKSIELFINTDEIIVIHGARQVGKTSLLQLIIEKFNLRNYAYFDLEDFRFLELFEQGVDKVVNHIENRFDIDKNKKFYVLIDEIQYLSNPSSFLKIFHDHYKWFKLIVSGSSSFDIKKKFKDSLVGRTVNFELYPLDFEEFILFKNENINIRKKITDQIIIEKLKNYFKEYLIFGGYPKVVLETNILRKEKYLQQIIDTYLKKDIRDIGNIKNILKFNKLLGLLSHYNGKLLNISEISKILGIAKQTVEEYIFILEATFVIKLVHPFYTNLKKEITKTPKIFFYDSGLRNLIFYKQFPEIITGEMFEAGIFSELVKNFGKSNIYYWRTQDKKEIDFILNLKKQIIPIEVKLNSAQFSKTPLKYFSQKYHTDKNFVVVFEKNKIDNNEFKFIYPWEILNSI